MRNSDFAEHARMHKQHQGEQDQQSRQDVRVDSAPEESLTGDGKTPYKQQ